ncbi:MAG: tyrosine--tRNA ligase [Candidatus Woykebacteria bacterium GWB1_45_5]|uniref:Tyrosine--tRNA ligase n=2 Tax=Candidatus Woykeibacteriota TaxID=1817899 RepID=A0A1G1W3L8_9BACT|nr:MAG: tyrosine--tRNA ligase [Candidatus Woykebacteria bacterium GWA1_44_8]OGY24474.1 MAG: tyrosine--tRNA ligase [Candidatus Woykebacteria bacterium GWB1_45_5]
MSRINELLTRGVAEIIEEQSLKQRLASGKKLVVKLGIDPTASKLHLGHYLVLQKLRDFQDAGHQAVLVIGDFTATIGDPSGRTTKRVALTKQKIKENMKDYTTQAGKIVDLGRAKTVYNSSWFNNLGIDGIIELASKATFSQIMERKEFRTRLKRDHLSMLESFYPLLQGYDSVKLAADVEIGGLDQKLNLLMGRQIQKRYGQKEQDIVLTPLLRGLDGVEKMSKSAGNYIAFADSAENIFGKIMSIPDSLMREYFIYCSRVPNEQIDTVFSDLSNKKITPIEAKKKLAYEIVRVYYDEGWAVKARREFERVFQEKGEPRPTILAIGAEQKIKALDFLIKNKLASSKSAARRLIIQGGFKIDGQQIRDPKTMVTLKKGLNLRLGKFKSLEIILKGGQK